MLEYKKTTSDKLIDPSYQLSITPVINISENNFSIIAIFAAVFSYGKTAAASPYRIRAITNTNIKPNWMASKVARTAPTTDAQPFTAQAHGIRASVSAPTPARAKGKGIPMQKASGPISKTVDRAFTPSGKPIIAENMGPRAKR
jgi:hypothetical protein